MIGPSAIGSENGTPTSTMSAPARSSPRRRSRLRSTSGCPAVMYGISACRPSARRRAKQDVSVLDEVVTDANAIALGILRLDDRAREHPILESIGEVDQLARKEKLPLVVTDHAHNGPREHLLNRVRRVHDAEL